MNKRLAIVIAINVFLSVNLQSFQKSWEEEWRDFASFMGQADKAIEILSVIKQMKEKLYSFRVDEKELTEEQKKQYSVLKKVFEARCKALGILGDVELLLLNDQHAMGYRPGFRVVQIQPRY